MYFSILQHIDKLTILQIRHCLHIGSADESSRPTGEIWQLLVPLAMSGSEFSLLQLDPLWYKFFAKCLFECRIIFPHARWQTLKFATRMYTLYITSWSKAAPPIQMMRNCSFCLLLQPLITAQSSKWDIHKSHSSLSNALNDSGISTGQFCNTEVNVP